MENTSLEEKIKNLKVKLSQARTQIERMFSAKLDEVLSAQKPSSDKTGLGYVLKMIYICPNNLPLWQLVTKPQQSNEHMREVINHSSHTHLLNTIKSIIIETLEILCKKRVYGK